MSKEEEKMNTSLDKTESIATRIVSSFNTMITYWGVSINNTFNLSKDLINAKEEESSTIVDKKVTLEVFPNDKEVMKIIWKYLSFEDKRKCTLVCKNFNDIISNMDCFRLVLKRTSMLHIIPKVSRSYKTLVIQGYRCKTLTPAMRQMLKQLSQSLIDLTLDGCELNLNWSGVSFI